MGFREDLARKIERKKAEISDFEDQLKTARTYLQALEDMYKLAARETGSTPVSSAAPSITRTTTGESFRAGSMTLKVYEAIKQAGKPLHVTELLKAIGREVTRAERSAVSGTLASYVRKGEVFTRPAPNTFGLTEFGEQDFAPEATPPLGFGQL